mmetsp:Transcript_1983/g.3535  ORF Transcript_1983/g.3535 Transcript_1983/m.3535 type:complete len:820 (-) Transcript_1983:1190-3649(-)
MGYTPDIGTASVFSTLTLNSIIGVVCFILFEVFRSNREIYAPRSRTKVDRCPPITPGFAAWIMPLLNISDEDTLKLIGLDGYVMLRFLLLCARMGMGAGLFGLITLLPLYSTSPGVDDVIGMNLHTMANVRARSERLWGPFICMYLFSFFFMYLLYKEYENFVSLRQQYFSEGDPDVPPQQLFSIIVENIPEEFRRSNALKDLFESLFPGQVSSAQIALKYAPLMELAAERKTVIAKLEKSVALYEASEKKERPMVKLNKERKPQLLPCGGIESDAIEYFQGELQRLNMAIAAFKKSGVELANSSVELVKVKPSLFSRKSESEQVPTDEENVDAAKEETAGPSTTSNDSTDASGKKIAFGVEDIVGTGFVTFTSRRAQAAACQLTLLSSKHPNLKAFPAHAPHDTIWPNISKSLAAIKASYMITGYTLTAGIMFWASVLAFIAVISQLSTLEKFLPFLKQLDTVTYSLLQGQLPVIALIVFIALLPVIFTAVATHIEGRKSVYDIRSQVFDWFFFYQMANVYLMLLAGSVFGALADVLDNPVSIVSILANALPTVSTFFINFMLTGLLSGVPLMMLRIGPIVIFKLYCKIMNPNKITRREFLEGPLKNAPIKYEILMPKMLYLVAIMLTFMVISPILLIISGVMFSALFLAWKYQLCYVITPPSQMGGMLWYRLYKYSMTALLASTVTMIGYMGIKEGIAQSALLIPLPFVVKFVWNNTNEKFESGSLDMAHSEAVDVDTRTDEQGSEELSAKFSAGFFVPKELNDENPLEFSTPMVYRLANTPLINPETGALDEAYFKPTFANEFNALSQTEDEIYKI